MTDTDETPTESPEYSELGKQSSGDAAEEADEIDLIVECGVCGARWKDMTKGTLTACPSCGREETLRVIAGEFMDETMWWFSGVSSLGEFVTALETRAEQFSRLEDEGWELDRPIKGGEIHLQKKEEE